jgi:hypothetical protein
VAFGGKPLAQCGRQFFCAYSATGGQVLKGDFTMANQNDKTRKAYRQGELLFIPLNGEDLAMLYPDIKDPSHRLWKKLGSNVLREGEATGHKHELILTFWFSVFAEADRIH